MLRRRDEYKRYDFKQYMRDTLVLTRRGERERNTLKLAKKEKATSKNAVLFKKELLKKGLIST